MKNLLKGMFLSAALFLAAGTVQALDYTVDLSTRIPNNSAEEFSNGGYPNRSGGVKVRQIILANNGATAQTVSVWDTATSSAAATLAMKLVAPTTGTYVFEFPAEKFRLSSPAFNKSATGSSVQLNLIYE